MAALPFTLRQLDVFESLAHHCSFRNCAEDLGISQASVSNQIKALEQQLGIELVGRHPGRRPSLTLEGQAFLVDLRSFRVACDALSDHRRVRPATNSLRKFRLLIGQPYFERYVRPHLNTFLASNPYIELNFDSIAPSKRVQKEIEGNRYDFAILHTKECFATDPRFQELATVRTGIIGHQQFCEGKRLPLTAQDVSELPFILYPAGTDVSREALAAFKRYGIRPKIVSGRTFHIDVMIKMVEEGIGVASIPENVLNGPLSTEVRFLFILDDWKTVLFRKDPQKDAVREVVNNFLCTCVARGQQVITDHI
ncbi:LysR family transcriptional regulator [Novosphingobium sp. JCM 18896]|uniref:LysR family transcriptional regulator n=1 Tax=Novosphingobium sp. JCM 18896 TaxID=2989731 RepID=UPI002223377D|nr:LysR family transcriptional regulator [Novosphingobium sp. JCM 18896]MCW1432424.1 LysR family transcriptional regulator [Novosphingobium sp. JCM 18896]